MKNLNFLLDGGGGEQQAGKKGPAWDVSVELSAPQILVPEHFVDKEALIMVLDLGKFHLTNAKEGLRAGAAKSGGPTIVVQNDEDDEDDEDEEFVTPASSPGEPMEEEDVTAADATAERLAAAAASDSAAIVRRIYDRFSMSMAGMQVIVGRIKDNWRGAYLKGTSSLHVLDRFSISLQCERRSVRTQDPSWPALAVSGTLPKLVVHVNEEKIFAMERMAT